MRCSGFHQWICHKIQKQLALHRLVNSAQHCGSSRGLTGYAWVRLGLLLNAGRIQHCVAGCHWKSERSWGSTVSLVGTPPLSSTSFSFFLVFPDRISCNSSWSQYLAEVGLELQSSRLHPLTARITARLSLSNTSTL